jgi:hypothetical protein
MPIISTKNFNSLLISNSGNYAEILQLSFNLNFAQQKQHETETKHTHKNHTLEIYPGNPSGENQQRRGFIGLLRKELQQQISREFLTVRR